MPSELSQCKENMDFNHYHQETHLTTQQKLHVFWRRLFLKNIPSFDCLHPCQPEYEQACFCAYVSIFACLHLGMCVCGFKRCPDVLSCVTQFWSSLSFLPGPVLVFRAPPEGPLARWERCWRRPGPAVLLPSPLHRVPGTACTTGKPSLTMRLPAQPTPCLNRAGGCHVMLNTHMHEGLLAHTNTHKHKSPWGWLLVGSTHVWKTLRRWE